jgi:hypothetical protein
VNLETITVERLIIDLRRDVGPRRMPSYGGPPSLTSAADISLGALDHLAGSGILPPFATHFL